MIVNTNIASLKMNEASMNNTNKLNNSNEKISSGEKLQKMNNEPLSLSIVDKLRTQISSLNQSVDNGLSAVAILQIADKAMAEQSNILDSIKSRLIQAKTTTNKEDRTTIIKDINRLLFQLDNIAAQTNYKGTSLLQKSTADPNAVNELHFYMDEIDKNTISIDADDIQANTEGLRLVTLKEYRDGEDLTQETAKVQLEVINDALDKLNKYRSEYGSTQLQIESSTKNRMNEMSNLKESESVIKNVDYAEESADLVHDHVLMMTGGYVVSQANSVPQNVLYLLKT